MRLIRLLVPDDDRETILDVLREEDIDHLLIDDAGDREDVSLVEFPLPTQAVGYVLGELRAAGLDDTRYTVIASAETAKTRHFAELEDRFVAGVEEDDAVAHEEIRAKAFDMHRNALTYYVMTTCSAVVAAAGLLLDSAAIVVGAMVIAPQVGSAMMTSVGTALNNRKMVGLGLRSQAFGLGVAVLVALVVAFFLREAAIAPSILDVTAVGQVSQRTSPGLLALAVAICAGVAGAFGLATGLAEALVGVMIAAALIPAAAAVGIGLAWGRPLVALGAFGLLVVNTVAVNLSGFLTLWYLGYRPAGRHESIDAGQGVRQYGPAVASIVFLLVAFLVSGAGMAGQVAFDRDVNRAVEDVLDEQRYRALELESVRTEFNALHGTLGGEREVTVVVSRPTDRSYPDLPRTLGERIEARTGQSVAVSVEVRDRREYRPPERLPAGPVPSFSLATIALSTHWIDGRRG